MWIFVKVTENSCMIKQVEVGQLTEGDWIVSDVILQKKTFLKTKDAVLGEKNKRLLEEYAEKTDFLVTIEPRWQHGYAKTAVLSKLKVGDVLRTALSIDTIKLKNGTTLSDEHVEEIQLHLQKHVLLDVSIARRTLGLSRVIKKMPCQKLHSTDVLLTNIHTAYYVCGPNDLGISKPQIKELEKLKRKGIVQRITIKEGIPFVPSFLLTMLFNLAYGDWFIRILHLLGL
jgi:hypothetical protein